MPSTFTATGTHTKLYTVNGGVAPGHTQPDWLGSTLTRAHRDKAKKKRKPIAPGTEGKSLIQDFDFPEASNKIKSTSDGRYMIATGTYKPRMKVFDLDELAMKFDRVTDSENIDFCTLSTDWTKTIHLQTDRTLDLHTQTASLYRVRIPKHGRALAYHFPSCDALCGGAGSELWRLNLEQGRFLAPFQLSEEVLGINTIDINPVHGLISLGTETESGEGTIEFWDHRARARAGRLSLPCSSLGGGPISNLATTQNSVPISVTALASRLDGLTVAVGTSSGHTLLYDLRAAMPHTTKDQGYGLPIKKIEWPTSIAASGFGQNEGFVATADSNVVKIWSRHTTENLVSVNPVSPINDMHIYPESGLIFLANEASPMTGYFVPALGPAPKWCRFLENMTEEMEESKEPAIYDDYKFVSDSELKALVLDHLIGTPALRPYMHGYFVDLRLYAKAKAIANPFAYIEHRDKLVKEKLEKQQESRIRASKAHQKSHEADKMLEEIKINKELAERILEQDNKLQRKRQQDHSLDTEQKAAPSGSLLQDSRFKDLFTNEDFEIDEFSREYAAVNPSSVASVRKKLRDMGHDSESEGTEVGSDNQSDGEEEIEDSDDSSEDDDIWKKSRRKAESSDKRQKRKATTQQIPTPSASNEYEPNNRPQMLIDQDDADALALRSRSKQTTFGKRLAGETEGGRKGKGNNSDSKSESVRVLPGGGMELSFIPSEEPVQEAPSKAKPKAKVSETFGIGLSKGSKEDDEVQLEGEEKTGRTKRRRVERSASKTKVRSL
ncbi:uncharacterized protein MELLADRAFT_49259 [Melampsora larici-populina 98AG31]|uniref:Uncharacterized protein n=1 Tax=Melampsora larici-populina (strain 98AG31 / pathotype 3-4-7) TaxID=747676 RepID=F4RTY8_MELLP|nr:uncharacterized protein MELLADRAFT_49259 [Melampsora larici-populina 98AG31]EGG04088.1 hypothetical protein MELLADRAFT_49259 [Melampsora larici-populina 98AG31]